MAFDGDIFRAITNLRMVLNTETDSDSPDNETTYAALREMVEILFQLCFDTGVSGTVTEEPDDDTNGYLVDDTQSWADDAHNGHTLLICSGLAIGNLYTIDDTVNASTRLECTGDNLYSDGVRSGDDYKVLYDIKSNLDGHDHDRINSKGVVLGVTPGTYVECYIGESTGDVWSTSWQKFNEAVIGRPGTYTVSFDLKGIYAVSEAFGRIYKNGVPYGTEQSDITSAYVTKSENLYFDTGDLIQFYGKNGYGNYGKMQNFYLYVENPIVTVVSL